MSAPHKVKDWDHSSPSQIKTFRRCARKWHLEKICGLAQAESAAMRFGTLQHAVIEHYLKTGGIPAIDMLQHTGWDGTTGADFDKAVANLIQAQAFMPDPPVAPQLIERPVRTSKLPPSLNRVTPQGVFPAPDFAAPIWGFVDLVEVPGENRPEGTVLTVTDWKTTSDRRWARTPEELQHDPQAIIYCDSVLREWPAYSNRIDFRHVYLLTRRGPAVWEVRTSFTRAALDQRLEAIASTIGKQWEGSRVDSPAELPANLTACGDYGGCPHRATCASLGDRTMGALSGMLAGLAGNSTTKDKGNGMGLADMLAARKKEQAGGVDTTAPTSASEPGADPVSPTSATAFGGMKSLVQNGRTSTAAPNIANGPRTKPPGPADINPGDGTAMDDPAVPPPKEKKTRKKRDPGPMVPVVADIVCEACKGAGIGCETCKGVGTLGVRETEVPAKGLGKKALVSALDEWRARLKAAGKPLPTAGDGSCFWISAKGDGQAPYAPRKTKPAKGELVDEVALMHKILGDPIRTAAQPAPADAAAQPAPLAPVQAPPPAEAPDPDKVAAALEPGGKAEADWLKVMADRIETGKTVLAHTDGQHSTPAGAVHVMRSAHRILMDRDTGLLGREVQRLTLEKEAIAIERDGLIKCVHSLEGEADMRRATELAALSTVQAREVARVAAPYEASGLVLYINCRPRTRDPVTYLEDLLITFQEKVAADAVIPHYSLLQYREGFTRVAALVAQTWGDGVLDFSASRVAIICDRDMPGAKDVLEVMIPRAVEVIEG